MPLYEYECPGCGVFEALSNYGENCRPCPGCGRTSKKIISLPAHARFIGPGFYAWDYKEGPNFNRIGKYFETGEPQR
jgi:putative FmdB family regulatory protein